MPKHVIEMRVIAGNILSATYNLGIGLLPSRKLRMLFLRMWLRSIGLGCSVQIGCRFLNARRIHLGDRCVINFGCLLDGRRFLIRVGNDVSVGPEASILTLGHDPQCPDFSDRGGDVIIGDRAWIGFRAIILPGVTIGEGAVVGAGAVVTRSVSPYTIVAGNPAREIGRRERGLRYQLDYRPWLM